MKRATDLIVSTGCLVLAFLLRLWAGISTFWLAEHLYHLHLQGWRGVTPRFLLQAAVVGVAWETSRWLREMAARVREGEQRRESRRERSARRERMRWQGLSLNEKIREHYRMKGELPTREMADRWEREREREREEAA